MLAQWARVGFNLDTNYLANMLIFAAQIMPTNSFERKNARACYAHAAALLGRTVCQKLTSEEVSCLILEAKDCHAKQPLLTEHKKLGSEVLVCAINVSTFPFESFIAGSL